MNIPLDYVMLYRIADDIKHHEFITPACECGELVHDGPHDLARTRREFLEQLRANEGALLALPEGWQLSWL